MDSVIFDQAGNLYSTTLEGGSLNNCGGVGCGVVFKLTPNSDGMWRETVLHRFLDRPGAFPDGVIFDEAGNLYGTTRGTARQPSVRCLRSRRSRVPGG